MTPTSFYHLLRNIDSNNYMQYRFRGMVEDSLFKELEEKGYITLTFAALYHNPEGPLTAYQSISFHDFTLDEKGFRKLQVYNWFKGAPIICCMVGFTVLVENNLKLKEKVVIITLEDVFTTHFKMLRVLGDKSLQILEAPESMEIIAGLSMELKLFSKIIDSGIDILSKN